MAGDWYVRIDFNYPYGGVVSRITEAGTLAIEIPFGDKRSAMIALSKARLSVVGEHPVVPGQVVADPASIEGAGDG